MRFLVLFIIGFSIGFLLHQCTRAHAKTEPVRPEIRQELPKKALVRPDCKVILVRRSTLLLKMADGTVVPIGALSAIRTRC